MQRQTMVSRSYQYSYSMRMINRIVLSRRLCTRSRQIRNFLERTEVTIYLLLLIASIFIVSIVRDVQTNILSKEYHHIVYGNTTDTSGLELIPVGNSLINMANEIIASDDLEMVMIEPVSISEPIQDIPVFEEISEDIPVVDTQVETIKPIIEDEPIVDLFSILDANLGNDVIDLNGIHTLQRYDLPDKYYPGIDFSSFQPYMSYKCITNKSSSAYAVSHSENAYTDEYGLRRYKTTEEQFTVNGEDDYIVALGTFYKEKGTCGSRYLIVTTTGMFTVITGDEKADVHTDEHHMFSLHKNGTCAGVIEWIVDVDSLESTMKRSGTITSGPVTPIQGEIIHIYGIE